MLGIDYQKEYGGIDRKLFRRFVKRSYSRRIRTLAEWCEAEAIIPTGPFSGLKFRLDRQPFARILFDAFEHPYWREYAVTACSQSGKSLLAFSLPVVYCLTELQTDVILAGPTHEIIADKLKRDIMPLMESSGYGHLIPKFGGGSKGGVPTRVDFANGATLKLMSFFGSDASKASFTCPRIFITEASAAIRQSAASVEANPIEQIKARARATERADRWIVLESTLTTKEGLMWQLYHEQGSAGRLALPCPHCKEYVTPSREHLRGWEQATNEIQAEEFSKWHCPSCDKPWTEPERMTANANALLLHRGQTATKSGEIIGDLPETRLMGFRWGPQNSSLLPASDIGVDCWLAQRDEDELNAERKLSQFVFGECYEPEGLDRVELDRDEVERRQTSTTKGAAPKTTKFLTIGVDVGLYDVHWTAVAWCLPERVGVIIDYGRLNVKMQDANQEWQTAKTVGFSQVFNYCMDQWKEKIDLGFPTLDGEVLDYDALWIDARYQGDDPDEPVVYDTIRRWSDKRVMPIMGHGSGIFGGAYRQPRLHAKNLMRIGNEYHVKYVDEIRMPRAHINSDAWKVITQRRFMSNPDEPGALQLYSSMNPREHAAFVKHLSAEVLDRHFEPGKGMVTKWEIKRQANHWLDSTSYACAAGHHAGFRVSKASKSKRGRKAASTNQAAPAAMTGRGGRAFVATQRK